MRRACFAFVSCLLTILSVPAFAQISPTTGAVRVHVVDPSKAVVPNASVVLLNTTVGLRREGVTQADGSYIFPLVPPATDYEVDVTAPNFAKAVLQNLIVRVTEVTDANVTLQLATAAEKITVTAATETVQTASPTTGNTITGEVIEQLPLFRNPLALLGTDAGVVSDGQGGVSVTGSRGASNNFRLNGADANNFEFNDVVPGTVPVPDPDAVQELKTQTSLFDATSGRSAGGDFNLITRSGTSHYHGALYEFNEDSALAANDWFRNANGKSNAQLLQNTFGGNLGGPVPLLKKTYWFTNYEGVRQTNPTNVQGPMPVLPATRDANSLEQAFSLPAGSIDPVAVNILNLKGPFGGFLFPSATRTPLPPVGQLGTFFAVATDTFQSDQVSSKLDNDSDLFGHNNRISLSLYWYQDHAFAPVQVFNLGPSQAFNDKLPSYSLEDTFFITNNVLNSFTFGFSKEAFLGNNEINATPLSAVGMTRFNQQQFPQLPMLSFSDQMPLSFGTPEEAMPQQRSHTYSLRDIVSIDHGKHTIRAGGEIRWNTFKFNDTFNFRGALFFGPLPGNADRLSPAPNSATDISFRDFLVGAPDSFNIASGATDFNYGATDYGLFIQDDYRLSPRLTLNLGLRWDLDGNIGEKHGQISTFDFSRVSKSAALNGGPGLQQGFLIPASVPGFGVPGVPNSTILNLDKKNFAPRIGFAYDVFGNGKMAVRGGFGLFYSRYSAIGALETSSQPPFALSLFNGNFNSGILNNPFPALPLPNQFPLFTPFPAFAGIDPNFGFANFNAGGQAGASPIFLIGADPRSHTPYEEKWNLTAQYEFLPGWAFEAGYVGGHGVRLANTRALDAPLLRNDNNPGPVGPGTSPGGLDVNSAFNMEARSPVVGISSFSLFQTTDAQSWYDGLVLTVSHQYAKGLYVKAAYTFSHSLDNQSGGGNGESDFGAIAGNQFLLNQNKGSSDFDIRHRVALTYVYQLPGLRDGALNYALGGWSLSGVTSFQTGFPFSVEQLISEFSGFGGFANIVPGCQLYESGSPEKFTNLSPLNTDSYINPNCFTLSPVLNPGQMFGPLAPNEGPGNQIYTVDPANYPFEAGIAPYGQLPGTGPRNLLRGPVLQDWDMSLAKKFPVRKVLGEGGSITFRLDAVNAFNHPSFAPPIPQFSFTPTTFIANPLPGQSGNGNPLFGKITFTQSTPRTLQLAVRFNF